jgi:hypothetical protein
VGAGAAGAQQRDQPGEKGDTGEMPHAVRA